MCMKLCTSCDRTLPFEKFSRNKAKKDGYQTVCKECKKHYNKTYYIKTKDIHNPKRHERRERYRKELRERYFNLLKSLSCIDCGISDWRVIEFDHMRDKVDNISHMVRTCRPWSVILEEIDKCEPVCANCHKIRTADAQNWFIDFRD